MTKQYKPTPFGSTILIITAENFGQNPEIEPNLF